MSPIPSVRAEPWRRALRALRAVDWWYFALLPLAAMVGDPLGSGPGVRALVGVVIAAGCLAFAYGINDVTDRDLDHDVGKNALVGASSVPSAVFFLVGLCAIASFVLALAIGRNAPLATSVSLLAGTVYSAGPRLKRFPIVGTVVNVLIFAPLPLIAAAADPTPAERLLTHCFCVLLTQNQLLHELADAGEDERGGVRTTAPTVGRAGLALLAILLGPVASIPLLTSSVHRLPSLLGASGLGIGCLFVLLCTRPRASSFRVLHRWFSLSLGIVLFASLAVRTLL